MNKFVSIFIDSFLEIKSRWIIYVMAAIVFLIVFVILVLPAVKIQGQDVLKSGMIDEEMLNEVSAYFNKFIIDDFFILLMIFGTAWFLPSYLKKGRIELAVSKPISRPVLLLMKFAAVYLNMIIILTAMSIIIWLVYSLKVGGFNLYFFPGLLMCFFQFLVIYSIIFFFGVWSNSGALALIGYFVIAYAHKILAFRETVFRFIDSKTWETILDSLYNILPKTQAISVNILSVFKGDGIEEFFPLWTSLLFGVVMIGISIILFMRRDF